MHDSYVSSVYDDSTPSRNTPSSKSPAKGAATFRDSASVYPEDSPQAAYPSSRAIPQQEFPPSPLGYTSSAYPSSKTTPHINTTELDPPPRPRPGETSPASSRTTAMNALSAAIAAGFNTAPKMETPRTPPSRTFSPVRMPFGEDSRPRSLEEQSQEEIAPPELIDPPSGKTPMLTPSSIKSGQSTNPLLGLGISKPGMSSKVPVTKRPPRLDIDAVRDAQARGSTTSLTDLIKRATKLASNLDRGKTASRLGMLDGFGSKEHLGQFGPGKRDSTMSDMLSSFPAPATLGGTPRRETMWPLGEKDGYFDQDSKDKNQKKNRRCCGMSLPVAILVLVVLVILIAAAVLIPIFLILVPKQHQSTTDLGQCAQSYPCSNGGASVVVSNNCQCICSDGFVGSYCGMVGGATDCTTMSVTEGANHYNNATMGKSVMPLFSEARSQFDVPLNASVVLSLFASNELSCTAENSLVNFNTTTSSSKQKRFVIVPGLEPELEYTPHLVPVPTHTTPSPLITPTPVLQPRQDSTIGSSNGIVFQTSAGTEPTGAAASVISTYIDPSATFSAAAPTTTAAVDETTTEKQMNFARVVVLYALQVSGTTVFTVNAQQSMNLFFDGVASNNTVTIGSQALSLTVNFDKFTITGSDGTVVGGNGGS